MTSTLDQLPPSQLLYPDLEQELAKTRQMLERYPDGKGDWRPHAKSMTLGKLASHVAELPYLGVALLTRDEMEASERKRAPTLDSAADLVKTFDPLAAELRQAADDIDLAGLEKTWTFRFGDRVILSAPRYVLMRGFVMNHLIHHRAQLGVYYRELGVPLPGMYGPSADEPL